MKKDITLNLKYAPTLIAAILFILLLSGSLFLFFGRNVRAIRISLLSDGLPGFYSHVSNFSISFALLTIISFIWLAMGVSFKPVLIMALLITIFNFICEKWVTILNTPDLVDAYYGYAGVGCALIYLLWVKFFGLKKMIF